MVRSIACVASRSRLAAALLHMRRHLAGFGVLERMKKHLQLMPAREEALDDLLVARGVASPR
jgi:hypothetical protein